MSRTELIILLFSTGIGATAIILFAVRCIFMCRTKDDAVRAKVKRDEELLRAVKSLEQIASDMEKWIQKQRDKFKRATKAFRKKWISHWFSDFLIMELFKDKLHRMHFDDIVDTLRLYIPDIVESVKEIKNNFLSCAKFMKQIEKHKGSMEGNHDLGFWCGNFFDTTADPTVERLRQAAELTREYLTVEKQEEAAGKRPKEILDKQVGKVLRSSTRDITATEIARVLNENFIGVYKPISPCLVGKTEQWKRHHNKKDGRRGK